MKLSVPQWDEWIILLKGHIDRRPLMKPGDVYKLLYQGILGPEHLIDSPSAFAKHLLTEYESLTSGLEDPLLEPIHPMRAFYASTSGHLRLPGKTSACWSKPACRPLGKDGAHRRNSVACGSTL